MGGTPQSDNRILVLVAEPGSPGAALLAPFATSDLRFVYKRVDESWSAVSHPTIAKFIANPRRHAKSDAEQAL